MSAGVGCGGLSHELEYASRPPIVVATVTDGRGRDLSREFGERVTPLVRTDGDHSEWADRAREHDAIVEGGAGECAAEIIQRPSRGGGALGEGVARGGPAHGEAAAGGAQDGNEIARRDPLAERRDETLGERRVGRGELRLGGRRNAELVRRFAAHLAVAAGALDEAIAFEEGELGSERGWRDSEVPSELVDRRRPVQQSGEDGAPGFTKCGSDSRWD